jgi:hypothetical protein
MIPPPGVVPPAPAIEPDGPCYRVELKTVASEDGHHSTVSFCPRFSVPAGQHFTMCFDGHEAVLGSRGHHLVSAGGRGHLGGTVAAQVAPAKHGYVHVQLDVEQNDVQKQDKDGTVVLSKGVHAAEVVRLGKAHRLVLERDGDKKPCRWLELTVSAIGDGEMTVAPPKGAPSCVPPHCSEVIAMPHPYGSEACEPKSCPGSGPPTFISDLCELLGNMFCETHVAGMTLPSGHYLQHPPQYFPPSPAFPLTRELAGQVAISEAIPPPPPVPTMPHACEGPQGPHHPMPVDGPAVVARTGEDMPSVAHHNDGIHVRLANGKEMLYRTVGAMPPVRLAAAEGQVCIHAGAIHVKADSLHASSKGTIVLEGHVHLHYTKGDVSSEVHASRIEINTIGEPSFTIKP